MTLPLENPTGAILRRLTRRSLQSEKRRNGMVVIAVALGAFLLPGGDHRRLPPPDPPGPDHRHL